MKGIIFGVVFAMVAAAVINYVIHLERNPLTNRLRFISLSKDQISSIVEFEEQSVSCEIIIHGVCFGSFISNYLSSKSLFVGNVDQFFVCLSLD